MTSADARLCFDRLQWWSRLLESRMTTGRELGWTGVWLPNEDVAALVRALHLATDVAASQCEVRTQPAWSPTEPQSL